LLTQPREKEGRELPIFCKRRVFCCCWPNEKPKKGEREIFPFFLSFLIFLSASVERRKDQEGERREDRKE
jgi:hypothetical protein